MNKKLILMTLMATLISLTACTANPSPSPRPATIQDPLLLKGWETLYNHPEAIQMPDGSRLSGRDLAQFVSDHAIQLLWAPTDDSRHASYSTLTCIDGVCTKENEPIYFSPSLAAQETDAFPWLVECMAHEIYHEMQPFGQVRDTLFEEFSAYYLSTRISQSQWAQFTGYDGLEVTSLTKWFTDHNLLYAYQDFRPYPQKVMWMVKQTAPTHPAEALPTDQVVLFNEPNALAKLGPTTYCIVIEPFGRQVCLPDK